MIKHILIIISAALAFSTSAFCQDHAAAEALDNLAAAINNYEAGLKRRHEEQQFWNFVQYHGYAPHGRANSGTWILDGLINLAKHMRFASESSLATSVLRH